MCLGINRLFAGPQTITGSMPAQAPVYTSSQVNQAPVYTGSQVNGRPLDKTIHNSVSTKHSCISQSYLGRSRGQQNIWASALFPDSTASGWYTEQMESENRLNDTQGTTKNTSEFTPPELLETTCYFCRVPLTHCICLVIPIIFFCFLAPLDYIKRAIMKSTLQV